LITSSKGDDLYRAGIAKAISYSDSNGKVVKTEKYGKDGSLLE